MTDKKAFSLVEIAVVVLIVGVITLAVFNGKALVTKANCVASTSSIKSITDNIDNPAALTTNKSKAYDDCINGVVVSSSATVDSPPVISGLTLWLDASDKSTIITTTGNAVDQWLDKSSNGNNASQSNSSNKPTTNLNKINNLNTIYYDGNDSLMVSNLTLNSEFAIFVVLKSVNFFIEHSTNTNAYDGFYFYGSGGGPLYIRRSGAAVVPNNSNWIGTSPAIGYAQNNGTSSGYAKNSSTFIASSSSSTLSKISATSNLYIGSRAGTGLFSIGDFAEIMIYNRALNIQEVNSTLSYLGTKWGIAVN